MATPLPPTHVDRNALNNLIGNPRSSQLPSNYSVVSQPIVRHHKAVPLYSSPIAVSPPPTVQNTQTQSVSQYIQKEQIVEGTSQWNKLPPMVSTLRIAPPLQPQPVERSRCGGCPPWLLGLLLLLSLLGLILTISSAKSHYSSSQVICREGQYLEKGKCLSCPQDHYWNGKKCIQQKHPEQKSLRQIEHRPKEQPSNQLPQENSTILPLSSNLAPPQAKNLTIPQSPNQKTVPEERKISLAPGSCSTGYFLHKGQCIRCPEGTNWNGTHCLKLIIKVTKVIQKQPEPPKCRPIQPPIDQPTEDDAKPQDKSSTVLSPSTNVVSNTAKTGLDSTQSATKQTIVQITKTTKTAGDTGSSTQAKVIQTKKIQQIEPKTSDRTMTVVIQDKPKQPQSSNKQTVAQPPHKNANNARPKQSYGTVILNHLDPSI